MTPAGLHHSFNFSSSTERDKHSLDCIVLNARSLRNKLLDFQSVVYAGKFDIVTVSETLLDDTVFDHEILPTGYTIFRKDRVDRRGGGVLMAFKSDITAWRRNDFESDCDLLCNLRSGSILVSRGTYCGVARSKIMISKLKEKWHGSDKKWNSSNHFCKETVNFYPFRYGTIGAYGPVA